MMTRKIWKAFLSSALLASALAVSASAQGVASGAPAHKREVAVTFDDLPAPQGDLEDMRRITNHLLESVKRNRVPAIGFVNEGKLYRRGEIDERTDLLRAWLDADFELGNHTYSHINLQRAPLKDYEDDVVRGETVTRMLLAERGMKLRYFRHPFLFTGTTPDYKRGLAEFLAARGYTVAPVTIDNGDYIFADVYFKAKKRGDVETAKRVADAYVPYMETVFDHFERLSNETFGREVKQVLLLHANELNADHFDELASMLRQRGYIFITLEEALKDPAYAEPDALYKSGISWIHRWRITKGLPLKWEPEAPKFVDELYKVGQRGN
jgi:peptidoglycan/xylan/chitin deacetylase (PgdA/CDA1 family)